MENTNPKKFRAELKDYLDHATSEPIKIQRRSGESYILINEDHYSDLKNEILNLQRRLLSMANVLDDDIESFPSSKERMKRFKGRDS